MLVLQSAKNAKQTQYAKTRLQPSMLDVCDAVLNLACYLLLRCPTLPSGEKAVSTSVYSQSEADFAATDMYQQNHLQALQDIRLGIWVPGH